MDSAIIEKIEYCLNCKARPCTKGCPLENNIPDFIQEAKKENYEEAFSILSKTTVLPAICGKICPHYKQCMGKCVRGIKGEPVHIGEIEEFIGLKSIENGYELPSCTEGRKESIAVIGSGPAGLTCAAFLRRKGFKVTIFEKYDKLGGILRNGIPEFRLDKKILDKTIEKILNLGIDVKYNQILGENVQIDELIRKFDAIFIAIGANVAKEMGIEGETLKGVYSGNELLEKNNHPDYRGKEVAIIGGGNVAIDSARTIKRLGAKNVSIIYRRAEEQMPAELKEIQDAKDDEIEFVFTTNIIKILGTEKVEKIECIKMELVEKEGETRKVPVEIEGSNYLKDIDYVVMALGSRTDEECLNSLNIELNEWKYLKVNGKNQTSNPKIFAGGDIVGEKATVAWAARSGRNAAENIEEYLDQIKP